MELLMKIVGKRNFLRFINKHMLCHGKATLKAHDIYLHITNHPFER